MTGPARRRVFITGALGFIGRTLGDRFQADGWTISGVDARPDLERGVVAGDITGAGEWEAALAGAELVIHTAAVVSNAVPYAETWRVNVLGTRRVAGAAAAGGAARLIHLSSIRAFGDRDFPDGVTEDWPVRPDGSAYVDTKIASEHVVLAAHAAGELAVTVIRPGDVYGPGSRPWVLMPLDLLRAGRFVLPAGGRGLFSPVYVDDLVDGIVLAAASPDAAGQILTLAGAGSVSTAEYFGHLARMLGQAGPRTAPTPVAVGLAGINAAVARLTGTPTEANPESMRYLARTGGYSIAKARRLIGYHPRVGLAEGMARTEAWLRAEGLLSP